MKKRALLFCCVLLFRNLLSAQISGLDISNDFGAVNSNAQRELQLLSKILNKHPYAPSQFSQTYFNSSFNCINTALVFKSKPFVLKSAFPKQEFIIGAGFFTINSTLNNYTNLSYDSVSPDNKQHLNNIRFNLYTHREQIHAAYYFNSRVFGKNFKVYFGLGTIIGFNTIKSATRNTISRLSYSSRPKSDTLFFPNQTNIELDGSYSYTTLSAYLPLGLKYNLSCDFNLFAELKPGIQFQPLATKDTQWQQFLSFGIGIRYKFFAEENDENETGIFW